MDFGEIAKYLVVAGAGAFAYEYWKKNQSRTNPDEIHSETRMGQLERMLRQAELESKIPKHQARALIAEYDDDL